MSLYPNVDQIAEDVLEHCGSDALKAAKIAASVALLRHADAVDDDGLHWYACCQLATLGIDPEALELEGGTDGQTV